MRVVLRSVFVPLQPWRQTRYKIRNRLHVSLQTLKLLNKPIGVCLQVNVIANESLLSSFQVQEEQEEEKQSGEGEAQWRSRRGERRRGDDGQ